MQLFHESLIDAVGSAIHAAGGTKRVAGLLWPPLDGTSASAKLRACLNPDQSHKLAPEELLRIAALAKEAGDHSIMSYLAMALGYEQPTPVTPEDQASALQQQFVDAVQLAAKFASQLTRLGIKAA